MTSVFAYLCCQRPGVPECQVSFLFLLVQCRYTIHDINSILFPRFHFILLCICDSDFLVSQTSPPSSVIRSLKVRLSDRTRFRSLLLSFKPKVPKHFSSRTLLSSWVYDGFFESLVGNLLYHRNPSLHYATFTLNVSSKIHVTPLFLPHILTLCSFLLHLSSQSSDVDRLLFTTLRLDLSPSSSLSKLLIVTQFHLSWVMGFSDFLFLFLLRTLFIPSILRTWSLLSFLPQLHSL